MLRRELGNLVDLILLLISFTGMIMYWLGIILLLLLILEIKKLDSLSIYRDAKEIKMTMFF